MGWINAYSQERGTRTTNVGSKSKWKQRLNYSCGLFQHTCVFCLIMRLALWLNVVGGESCGGKRHLKRLPKECLCVVTGQKLHVELLIVLAYIVTLWISGESVHLYYHLHNQKIVIWQRIRKRDQDFGNGVIYLGHLGFVFLTQGTLKREGAQHWVRLCSSVSHLLLLLPLLWEPWCSCLKALVMVCRDIRFS